MFERIRRPLGWSSQKGFSLIEVLIVVIIIGILLAIAVPSYIGFRDRANDNAAKTNIRSALPAVQTFHADNETYTGMTLAELQSIDQTVRLDGDPVVSATTYCIQSTVNGKAWKISWPERTTPAEGSC